MKSTLSKIDLLARPRYGNNILASLEVARDALFSTVNGARRDVPKTLILFISKTDGADRRLEATANTMKERGINVIVIATGSDINTKDLAGIASDQTKLIVPSDLTNAVENASLTAASKSLPGSVFSFLFSMCFIVSLVLLHKYRKTGKHELYYGARLCS